MRTVMPTPGLPAFCTTCTPAARPCIAASTPATGVFCSSAPPTDAIELLRFVRVSVP